MSSSGFINLIKPPGMTSHDVVARVRRRLPRKTKVGHLGTLDPAAAGVLPVAVGQATRLIPLLPDLGSASKAYLAHLQLGVTTTTDDLEGEVLNRAPLPELTRADIERELEAFRGPIQQVPPQISAVHKDGERAYKRARRGEVVELAARPVVIERLELTNFDESSGRIELYMVCGSGTYVRSLARDLGNALGVGGALAFLLRTHSGPFHLETGVTLEDLYSGGVSSHLIPCGYPFSALPSYEGPALIQKGQRVPGTFATSELHLAPNGLLEPLADEPGIAVVKALFGETV